MCWRSTWRANETQEQRGCERVIRIGGEGVLELVERVCWNRLSGCVVVYLACQ